MKRLLTYGLVGLLMMAIYVPAFSQVETSITTNSGMPKKVLGDNKRKLETHSETIEDGKKEMLSAKEQMKLMREQVRELKRDSLSNMNDRVSANKLQIKNVRERLKEHKKYNLYEERLGEYQNALDSLSRSMELLKEQRKNVDWQFLEDSLVSLSRQSAGTITQEIDLGDTLIIREYRDSIITQADSLTIQPEARLNEYAEQIGFRDSLLVDQLLDTAQHFAEEYFTKQTKSALSAYPIEDHLDEQILVDAMSAQGDKLQAYNPVSINETRLRYLSQVRSFNADSLLKENLEKIADAAVGLDSMQRRSASWGQFEERQKKSFKERTTWGGNIQLDFGESTAVDLSPWLGWKITKKWILATGVNYRSGWYFTDGIERDHEQSAYGYRVFSEYDVYHGFYVHGEYEHQYQIRSDPEASGTRTDYPGWLIGLGKSYRIKSKLSGNFQLLYQTNHAKGSFNDSPWVLRFGIRMN